jgi:hypothetical protein
MLFRYYDYTSWKSRQDEKFYFTNLQGAADSGYISDVEISVPK